MWRQGRHIRHNIDHPLYRFAVTDIETRDSKQGMVVTYARRALLEPFQCCFGAVLVAYLYKLDPYSIKVVLSEVQMLDSLLYHSRRIVS